MKKDWTSFKASLNATHSWPCEYVFKFIVPKAKQKEASCFVDNFLDFSVKESQNGRYVSLTVKKLMHSSDEVIAIYKKASKVEGIISL